MRSSKNYDIIENNTSNYNSTHNNDSSQNKDRGDLKQQLEFSTSSTFHDKDVNGGTEIQSKKIYGNISTSAEETETQADDLTIINKDSVIKNQEDSKQEDTLFVDSQITVHSKKPNFSVVCMLPSKQPRGMQNSLNSSKDKNHQIIEKQTLERILELQKQYQQNKQAYISQTSNSSGKTYRISLQMDKIGICGIPSLWMTKDELVREKHISIETNNERERLDKLLRILQIHKKYENEKYFGGQGLHKKGLQQLQQIQGGQSFINQDFVQFSSDILVQRQKGNFDNPEQFLFKIQQIEAKLVRLVLESHGFMHTESNDWNILWTCTSSQQKPYMYENLNENQKINHFVNACELTRKDRLCFNVGKMQMKFGKNHFDFLPETFILPDEFSEFYKNFNSVEIDSKDKNIWIVKPSSSSQGKGIFMIDDISEVPLNEALVISKYIGNPLLINGLKFDLRLYVLVTSFDPLKIYIYNEGLVRFASEPYDISNTKENVYAHLTNYSINKKSEHFIQNKNIAQRDFGNKWSLSALQTHLQKLGIDVKIIWERIYDSIIKSLLSIEHQVQIALKKIQNVNNTQHKSNSFDLFGFDIILDSDLKPWILEVNLSPSLAFDSPLDFHIKSNLVVDALNIVGLKKFTRRRDFLGKQLKVKTNNNINNPQPQQQSQNTNDQKKRYQSALNITQLNSQNGNTLNKTDTSGLAAQNKNQLIVDQVIHKNQYEGIDIQHVEKLSKISAKHRELLREHLEEFARNRKNNFTRIFPAPGTNSYEQYFEQPRQLNKMLYKYLYQQSDLSDIINSINKKQTQAPQKQQNPEPYSDNFVLNHNSSVNSMPKQEMPMNYTTQQYQAFKANSSDQDQQRQIRSSSISSLKNIGSSSINIKVPIELQSPPSESKLIEEPTLKFHMLQSPIQKRCLEEKRSVSNKQYESESKIDSDIDEQKESEEKVTITGDDILIEYVKRVMLTVKQFQSEISSSSNKKIELFLTHKVWYSKSQQNRQAESHQLWQRIETKYIEMQERKRRLFIKKQQKEGIISNQSDKYFLSNEKQKEDIIKDFTSNELEQMLIQSNKNNQIEVVSILLCGQISILNGVYYNSGILTKIEKESQRLSKNSSQMLKMMRISVEQNNESTYQHPENIYTSPKEQKIDKSQILARMKTSDDKVQQSTFNYKTQSNTYDQLHSSYSHSKNNTHGQNSVLYQNSQASSKQNLFLQKSGKKSTATVERDFSLKESDKKITLPSINNNHLSQDYSRVSIQLNNGVTSSIAINLDQADKLSKYRTRMSNEKYQVKKVRQQSLQVDNKKQNTLKIGKNQTNTKFERLDI